ncbi:MAG: leucine-rich repeat domain-containing protein [Clostridia bacterium]|nr:leucine-rich repeat domain-containing protein [Clostridia bacterium]
MENNKDFIIDRDGCLEEYTGKDKFICIPNGVKEISFRTFYGSDICGVRIPQSVEFIDVQAFLCCNNLKYVVIPKSVRAMDYAVFEDCKNLTDIFLEAEKGSDLGFDWDYGFKGSLHWAG